MGSGALAGLDFGAEFTVTFCFDAFSCFSPTDFGLLLFVDALMVELK